MEMKKDTGDEVDLYEEDYMDEDIDQTGKMKTQIKNRHRLGLSLITSYLFNQSEHGEKGVVSFDKQWTFTPAAARAPSAAAIII